MRTRRALRCTTSLVNETTNSNVLGPRGGGGRDGIVVVVVGTKEKENEDRERDSAMLVLMQRPSVLVAWKDDLRDGTIILRDPGPKLRRLLHLVVGRRPLRSCLPSCYQRTRSSAFCLYY
ncbi:hypothetical protein ALC60_11011 [Trachymyrmex zeteki]|uniref:Uncharacterized protein n=1 Tax=Mycetomoellerius zeteki TaxID=64791 RepID=A0A151WPP3_9HYME|nr:hypothetical protein ALC60_11011 [Trachymyrmex zeteki]